MSTRAVVAIGVASVFLGGCGWRLGNPTGIGTPLVTGVSLDPGARMALARGAAGRPVAIRLIAVDEIAQVGSALGGVVRTARVRARVGTPERPECGGDIAAERMWAAPDPTAAWAARAAAVAAAAEEVGRRAVDALESPSCRP